jgi:hypothetical protein
LTALLGGDMIAVGPDDGTVPGDARWAGPQLILGPVTLSVSKGRSLKTEQCSNSIIVCGVSGLLVERLLYKSRV